MSPLRASGGFSTSATGFTRRPQTLRARRKMPCSSTSDLRRELTDPAVRASQASMVSEVIDSSGIAPNVGSSWVRTIDA